MGCRIEIRAGQAVLTARLNDSPTAKAIEGAIPIEGVVQTWGDEIYFPIPVDMLLDETAKEVVSKGDIGYWPTGKAFCIFFGPTPVSGPGEIRPASVVNIVGQVEEDVEILKEVRDGEVVRIEKKD
ncbi:MAG TPA: hypothetical protein ENG14_05745 [Thermodesulforhabdus norvegica]|uniref:Cyclophilin TM1367-like domain-containing protein n=1 Tax=Thermodesulforhabdus norvegica TaxID=39841 RepID=A0A7C1AYT2_9BACT|nr:hypothetical protein [Thermodesulforhabdus norvegica]